MFIRFVRDSRGGVAPMLALTALPLMTAVGMSIDYTRANAAKSAFQAALDSSALMLSKQLQKGTVSDLAGTARAYVVSGFGHPEAQNVTVTANYTTSGGSTVAVSGSAEIPTQFMGMAGVSKIKIGGSATAVWGDRRLRVALVLDNTGSMAQSGKMDALKSASHNLLNQLQAAATAAEDVYVSIVPFSKDVNLGSANWNQSWLRWDLWDQDNGSCSKSKYTSQSRCVSNGYRWTPASHSSWNGCVTDRDQNFDTTNDAPVAGSTLYPAEQYSSCPVQALGLTNNWTVLSNKVDAMKPDGNTNQAIGLQVGWQTLTQSPFTVPAFDSDYKYSQVIILLSDGLNTEDRWYTSENAIDGRQSKTCDNVKAAGIEVYTVQVNTGGDPKSTLLETCASDKGKFFLLTSSNQIVTAFQQIGTAISQLHLSH
jgi:Flp pilus assembly protein TadG